MKLGLGHKQIEKIINLGSTEFNFDLWFIIQQYDFYLYIRDEGETPFNIKHCELLVRLAKSHNFVVSLTISPPISCSREFTTDFTHFLKKSNSKKVWSCTVCFQVRYQDSQLNPKKTLSSCVWLHSSSQLPLVAATKCEAVSLKIGTNKTQKLQIFKPNS